jgi:hypothetical protein
VLARTLNEQMTTIGGCGGMSDKRTSVILTGLRAALTVVAAAALAFAGVAQPAQALPSGSIAGAVYLPGGQPATDAEVCLFTEPSGGWPGTCVQTNPYGGFSFTGLDAGSYSLSASVDGYVTGYFGGTAYLKDRTTVQLGSGQVLRGKDVSVFAGAMITGRVVDSAGRPFGYDLTVKLTGPAEDPQPGAELRPGRSVDGTKPFTFGPVPDGTYRVTAESTLICTPQQVDPCQWTEAVVVVSGGHALTTPTLRLTGGTGFTGTVRFPGAADPNQAPSRLYQLQVYNRSGALVRSGVYEASTVKGTALVGSYQLHVDPGRYQLRFTPLDGTASYCLGCAGGLATKTGRLLNLGAITLAGPVKALATGGVQVSGTAQVGQTVTAITTGWPSGAKLSYQWLRNGHKISRSTRATRVLTAADLHARISVQVRASLGRAKSVQVTAKLADKVVRGQLGSGGVGIVGTAAAGQKLTATTSGWASGVRLSYRWLRDGAPIRRATGKIYRLSGADRGHQITVRVTAGKAGYRDASAVAAALAIPLM